VKTPSILDKICDLKRSELEVSKAARPFGKMLELACAAAERPRASFKSALKKSADGNPAIIAELKKASPSMGLIRADFNFETLACELEGAGAAALSVLTEKNYFQGSLEYLEKVSQKVKIPLLRKDFIFDEYQICEAAASGASAVLLIAKMLSAAEFARLSAFAKSLGLDVLSEAHDESEIEMLLSEGADIVGVNCRDLRNFKTDFEVSERLLKKIPDGCVRVCESAINSRALLLRAADAGADAALIGTALMSQKSVGKELEKLLGRR